MLIEAFTRCFVIPMIQIERGAFRRLISPICFGLGAQVRYNKRGGRPRMTTLAQNLITPSISRTPVALQKLIYAKNRL